MNRTIEDIEQVNDCQIQLLDTTSMISNIYPSSAMML